MKKVFSVILCVCMLAALAIPAMAAAENNGPSADMSTGSSAAIIVTDEGMTVDPESASVTLEGGTAEDGVVSGVMMTSDDNAAAGIIVKGGELAVGGEEDVYTVTTHFTGEELGFNTVISLTEVDGFDWSASSSGGNAIQNAGGVLTLENVYALNVGRGRYTVNLAKGTTVIKDCYFESAGTDGVFGDMPWFTAQYGNSRNLIACGTLTAYIYNSTVASEGYGSWSTDTGGNPYVFYLYNGDSINVYGGYGTYADTGLEVFVYGSRFDSAEYGAFVTNTGILNIGSSDDALAAEDEGFLENLQGEELAEDTPSEIIGDRNAIVFHVVDTMHQANPDTGVKDSAVSTAYTTVPVLNVTNSTLSTVGASYQCSNLYPVIMQAWMDHLAGSTIVFRGACGIANLTNVEMETSNGIIIQSCVDLDESTIQILDDVATEDIPGCVVNSTDNTWTGDISNEDYQRPMYLNFANTTLTGAIITKGLEDWNALYAEYADVAYEVGDDGYYVNVDDPTETKETFKVTDPTAIYGWLCAFDEYNAVRGTYLTMDADSVWNVTADSQLVSLTVEAGAVINGVVTVDGAVVDTTAGGTWTGDIVVTPAEAEAAEDAAADDAVPATDGTENEANALDSDVAPASQEEFDAYKAYLVDYMNNYTGEGDGTGFDDSAKTMAIGELDSVGFGSDVYAFPFEMFVTQFGAMTFAEYIAQ